MAIQEKFPSIRPSLNLDFANTKTLDPRVTFSRASTATYYDGKTVAKAEENLLLYSQEFDNASWSKFFAGGATIGVTANAGVAPDGTTTADRITATGDASALQLGPTLVSGVDYTISMWVKRAGASDQTFRLSINNGSTSAYSGNLTATDTWQRFSYTVTSVGTGNSAHRNGITRDSSNSAYDVLVWGAQLEQRSSVAAYTATTTQPITNYVPVLRTAAANVARFDHNPVTGESLGLLIEEQRTNLLTYSEQFDNTGAWGRHNLTVSGNSNVSPDGTLTADKLVENTTNNIHRVSKITSVTAGTSYTFSVYLKAGERQHAQVRYENSGATAIFAMRVDLLTGTFTTLTVGSPTGTSASLVSAGNGWWRAAITVTADTTSFLSAVYVHQTDIINSYTGDGFSGIYVWGAQLEAGSFPTSYIKTEASQVTRSADNASMTGANFSSWYRADEGTLYGEASGYAATTVANGSAAPTLVSAWDALYRSINIYRNDAGGSNGIATFVVTPAVVEAALGVTTASFNSGLVVKASGAYKRNDIAFSANGASALTDTSSLLPTPSSLQIGRLGSTYTGYWNGRIRKIAYYPKRLSNTQLQALTT